MMDRCKFHIFVALTCVYAVFIFYLSSLSHLPGPPAVESLYGLVHFLEYLGLEFLIYPLYFAYQHSDKLAHVILYMGFGLLLYLALCSSRNEVLIKYAAPLSILIGTLYAVTDEIHQSFVRYRSASLADLCADFVDLVIAQLLILIYTCLKKRLSARKVKKSVEVQKSSIKDTLVTSLDLGFVLLFAFLAYLFVLIPPLNQTPLRIIFALPLLLFLPGYVLIAAMFPRREELSGIERFTLSIGLAIAIFVFDGFAISVTAWRFRPESIILSLSLILLILTLITILIRLRIPMEERFQLDLSVFAKFCDSLRSEEKPSKIERALVIALVCSIIIASGVVIYAKITFEEERFTALYILGEDGKAEQYLKEVHLLEPSSLIVGIENYEHAPANYTLQVNFGDYLRHEQQIKLAHGETWDGVVSFAPKHVAKNAKLDFILYKDGSTDPYRSVHLWIDSLIDYDNLTAIRGYALSDLSAIKNPDMESESDWTFTENVGYFRGHFTKFYRLDENATVCGWITDNTTGKEIANARVSVNNHYGYKKSNMTDESGYYVIDTIADRLWLESRADRYKRAVDEFDIAGGQTLVVNMTNDLIMAFNMTVDELSVINATIETLSPKELPEGVSRVNGSVSDSVTGLPVANANVKVRNEYGFEKHTTTTGYGYFDVNTISGRSYIEVRADGYALNTTTVVMAGEHTINPELSPENSIINGFIYDNTTGASVSNAYIKVRSGRYYNTTRSNVSGYYAIRSIAGHIELEVSRGGYFPDDMKFNISYGETRTVDMLIEPIPAESSTISGYVCYKGTRLPGVTVVVSDHVKYEKSTLTDSNGYFEMDTIIGHLWLDVLPGVYMDSSVEFELKSEEIVTLDIELDALPNSRYQIMYPSETALVKGWYGGIYQDIESEAGVAALSFKVNDSYRTNRSEGCMYMQVLLNELIVWEDDVAEDEGWQAVRVPITLDNGTNRLMLRVYAEGAARCFPVTVCWDDVRIERFDRITDEIGTSFYILDAEGTEEYYPTELYLGEPAEVLVGIENNEQEPVNYTMQVRLNGEMLGSENIGLEDGSKYEQKLSFTPDQTGVLLKLEFLLFKDPMSEEPYKAVHRWVSSYIALGNLEVLEEYVVSPLPEIVDGDMESIAGWTYIENAINFTGRVTNTAFVSPMHSYELSYPADTPFETGYSAGIYQHFTSETYPATIVLSFNVRDSYTPDREGYYLKQILLNDEVIWEDDVGGDEKWQHVNVPVTLHSVTNKLMLRVYSARGSSSFPITVWWDDVTIEPITAVGAEISTPFYILDTKGTEEEYPTELYLGEPADVRVVIENNEHKQVNYILQMKLDGRLLKTKSKWLEHGYKWEQNISFTPDRIGENQKLEFLLFTDYVKDEPYRHSQLWVSTAINYYDLEPLSRYGIDSLPAVKDGDMGQVYEWTREPGYSGTFREGYHTDEYTSSPRSYCIQQYRDTNKGDYKGLSQDIYASEHGVVVLSFNVRDSFERTSEDAKNIIKQVILNNTVIWADDVSGKDAGYVGWIEEEYVGPYWVWNNYIKTHEGFVNWVGSKYDWWEEGWIKKRVPTVETGWTHVDILVYLREGNNELKLRVYAKEAAENLNVKVYWDDVEVRPINELVKVDERVRMKRYRW